MLKEIQHRYREREVLPINLRTLPYWVLRTYRAHRQQHRPKKLHGGFARALRLIKPNLRDPIFVLGAPRSGTTFLGECLAQLPELSYHFEPVLTKAGVRAIYDGEWNRTTGAFVYRSVYSWLMRLSNESELRFCDKTPGNCFIIPFLLQVFPKAQFVHILRDGRDSALSLSKKRWYRADMAGKGVRDADGYFCGPGKRFWVKDEQVDDYEHADDLHRCIWLWREYVESAIRGTRQVPETQLLELKYEEFIEEPSKHSRRILDFLGIDRSHSRQSFEEFVSRKANPGSLGRWRTEINEIQLAPMHADAGALLVSLGYPKT